MRFKYREDGNWQTSTLKCREGNQWVTVGGGDSGAGDSGDSPGDIPDRFYTVEPTRGAGDGSTGADIIHPHDGYSSIQAAFDALNPGERLWIDPAEGPYTETLRYDTNSVTVDGYDPNTDERATIQYSGGHTIAPSMDTFSHPTETELAGTIDDHAGQTVIEVDDASPFSAGDVVHISENRDPFIPPTGNKESPKTDWTTEYRIVKATDTTSSPNTITVDHEMLLPYANETTTSVGVLSFPVEDIRFHGLNVEGDSTKNVMPFYNRGVRQGWFDNLRVAEMDDGYLLGFRNCFECRCDDVLVENSDRYGITTYRGGSRGLYTDITSNNINRYATRFGANGDKTVSDYFIDGVTSTNDSGGFAVKAHYGGHNLIWKNVDAGNATPVARITSTGYTINGFTAKGGGDDNVDVFRISWYVENGWVGNTQEPIDGYGSGEVFSFFLDRSDRADEVHDLTFENIEINEFGGNSITQIGEFRFDGDGYINGLHFKNITYGGQQLTKSHVESWTGYDSSKIDNLTVE